LSHPRWQNGGMKNEKQNRKDELITQFGGAMLVKTREGKFELQGGSADNRTEAKEWMSLFLHEAVVSFCE